MTWRGFHIPPGPVIDSTPVSTGLLPPEPLYYANNEVGFYGWIFFVRTGFDTCKFRCIQIIE